MKHTEAETVAGTCPGAETLTAYLAATGALPAALAAGWNSAMSAAETQQITAHLAACDHCVEDLRTAQRRLLVAAEVSHAVPPAVAARAAAALSPARPAVAANPATWLAEARRWLNGALRLPVLVPAAAAVTLLVVFLPRPDASRPSSQELSRAVPLRQAARVTAATVSVRAERNADATAVAELRRGDQIDLVGEEGGWYRVSLADGTEGWIERTAFE